MNGLPARVIIATLREGAAARWVVRGASMWPAIPDGSEVEATPCAASDLRVGDVAAFTREGFLTVHRLVARRGDALVFRGDALARDDAPVAPDAVLGRVRVTRRAPLRWDVPRGVILRGALRFALEWARAKGQR